MNKFLGYTFVVASLVILIILIIGASDLFKKLVDLCFTFSETTDNPASTELISHLLLKALLILIAFITWRVGRRLLKKAKS